MAIGGRKPSGPSAAPASALPSPPPLVIIGVAGSHALSLDDGLAKCFSAAKVLGGNTVWIPYGGEFNRPTPFTF